MNITNDILRKVLLDTQLLTTEQFNLAEKSARTEAKPLANYISETNLVKDNQLGQLLANYFSLPYIDLTHISVTEDILNLIPELVARKRGMIAFQVDKDGVHVATSNPDDQEMISFMEKKTGKPIIIHYATERNIHDALDKYAKNVVVAFEDILAENIKQVRGSYGHSVEPPIIKIVDTVIEYAYKNKASDVHLEPEANYSLLRFRIDGMLHDIVRLPHEIHDQVVTRIKVMSNLRTDARQIPQDGKIHKVIYDEPLNLRVSIVPVTGGEKVVLRLLSEKARNLTLSDLGFKGVALDRITNAYKKPYGMILTTGPTGSGKTTTLYAILKRINVREVNIMTIEDPVEYDIEGVNQIQVNNKAGLTFSSGLRSIVRQDPDIILVGEIRDEETSKIAINSAMTGHLVLSTLHTNDAATAVPRLFDMGVEPFLVASSVNVIVGQRLVRKICEECRMSIDIEPDKWDEYEESIPKSIISKSFDMHEKARIYRGKGCEICNNTGYSGRIGIYEVLEISESVRKAIVEKQNAAQIQDIAVSEGMKTMTDDGLDKVKMGLTTIEEVIRVTKQ